jgi:hypothetical protein
MNKTIYPDDTVHCNKIGNNFFVDYLEICDKCPYFGGYIIGKEEIICRFNERDLCQEWG